MWVTGVWSFALGLRSVGRCLVDVSRNARSLQGERISDRLVWDTSVRYIPAVRRTEVKVALLLPVTVVRVFTVGGPSSNLATCVVFVAPRSLSWDPFALLWFWKSHLSASFCEV